MDGCKSPSRILRKKFAWYDAHMDLPDAERLYRASSSSLYRAMRDVAEAAAKGEPTKVAQDRLGRVLSEAMIYADLVGRARLIQEAGLEGRFAATSAPNAPLKRIPFREAIKQLLTRFPILERDAERLSRRYQSETVFGMVRAATRNVVERVQKFMADAVQSGKPTPDAADALAETEGFTRAYADTVYRTNLSVAFTAGRMEQARDPVIRRELPAYEVIGPESDDPDTRQGRPEDRGENHAAAVGLVAAVDDPIWETHTPPFGYSCRHSIRLVSREELKRRGLLRADGSVLRYEPPGFGAFAAHPNFTRSPMRRIYG